MVKSVFFKMKTIRPDALVMLSWLVFVLGVVEETTFLKLILLSAARILP